MCTFVMTGITSKNTLKAQDWTYFLKLISFNWDSVTKPVFTWVKSNAGFNGRGWGEGDDTAFFLKCIKWHQHI